MWIVTACVIYSSTAKSKQVCRLDSMYIIHCSQVLLKFVTLLTNCYKTKKPFALFTETIHYRFRMTPFPRMFTISNKLYYSVECN